METGCKGRTDVKRKKVEEEEWRGRTDVKGKKVEIIIKLPRNTL
jgi:hypothetical protein